MKDESALASRELNDDELEDVSGGVAENYSLHEPDTRLICKDCGHSFPFSTRFMGIRPKYCSECGSRNTRYEPL